MSEKSCEKNIKDEIEYLRKTIEYHNKRYYEDDESEISDYQYDMLKSKLRKLEKDNADLVDDNSPVDKVGGKTKSGFTKVKHDVPVVSLQDVFSKDEVFNFVKKMQMELKDVEFVVEKKIDGLSVVLRYNDGEFKEGITRGNGVIGESVYENLLEIKSIPKKIDVALPYLEVRGEVYISNENFEKVNKYQEEIGGKMYQNPRNLAAGTLRQLDPQIVKDRNLDIFIFNMEIAEKMEFDTHSQTLEWLSQRGFDISPGYKICKSADEVWDAINEIEDQRSSLEYGIDGAVVKLNSLKDRDRLGMTSSTPRWAVAYKYKPESKETVIESIEFMVGRTGRVTPLAILKPVRLAGTTVSKATLHNEDYIVNKDIRIGDTVLVEKAGDIIPSVVSVVKEKRNKDSIKFKFIKKCPICNESLVREEGLSDTRCININCPAQIVRSIAHFASKDAMDIVGFGESKVEALIKGGYIEDIADIYNLESYRNEIIKANIIGREKSVDNLIRAINDTRGNNIDKLIAGFGIRNVGKSASRVLADTFDDLDMIASASCKELKLLPEFGEVMVNDIVNYFSSDTYKNIRKKLEDFNVNLKSTSKAEVKGDSLEGLTFVITGTLPTMKRDEASSLIKSLGGKISSSVSKKTSYLLAGDSPGSKLSKATSLGVKIISEDDLINIINNK